MTIPNFLLRTVDNMESSRTVTQRSPFFFGAMAESSVDRVTLLKVLQLKSLDAHGSGTSQQ